MVNIIADLSDGIRRLQKLNKEMSEIELKEEILNLRQLLMDAKEDLLAKQERTLKCEACNHTETRMHDPSGKK